MSYFADCFNALLALTTANLNTNIKAACIRNGADWSDTDFTPGNGHFLAEDVEPGDVLALTELSFPCLCLYPETAKNLTYMMGQSFSGPVGFCVDMQLTSERNDTLSLSMLRMSVAEGLALTFDSFDPAILQNWITHAVAYSRGVDIKFEPSLLFKRTEQFADYQGVEMWSCKIKCGVRFNLIRR